MKAAVCDQLPAQALDVREVAEPAVGLDDLLLDIDACGICGTDLHILSGEAYRPSRLPFVLGHEPVGVVTRVGDDADQGWLGRRVAITLFTGCGVCDFCAAGDERLCTELRDITGVMSSWGGYAERMTVHEPQVVLVPDGLSSRDAAALVDAGATAANAARAVRDSGSNQVLVLGGGPVGFLVAELLRDACDLAIVEPAAARRELLRRLGYRVAADEAEIGVSPDAVVDCAGAASVVASAIEYLQPRGLYVVVGYSEVPLVDFAPVARKELHIRGVRSGSRDDLERVLNLAAAGEIRLPPIEAWPLERINDALEALRTGCVEGKAVIITRPEAA